MVSMVSGALSVRNVSKNACTSSAPARSVPRMGETSKNRTRDEPLATGASARSVRT